MDSQISQPLTVCTQLLVKRIYSWQPCIGAAHARRRKRRHALRVQVTPIWCHPREVATRLSPPSCKSHSTIRMARASLSRSQPFQLDLRLT